MRRLHITSFRRIYEVIWTQLDNGLKKEASRLLSFEKRVILQAGFRKPDGERALVEAVEESVPQRNGEPGGDVYAHRGGGGILFPSSVLRTSRKTADSNKSL